MMKRAVFAVFFGVLACGPVKEPKQAADKNEIPDDPANAGNGSSSSGSSGRSNNDIIVPGPGGSSGGVPGKTAKGEAPSVGSLESFKEGVRWGMSHAELTKLFTDNGGVIWKDYDEKLAKARVGPDQQALEAERESTRQAFGRTYIEFKDTPTGYDATGIKGEYTYKNREALMWVNRAGKKRYFFFINDKLWKVYDEYALSDTGAWGKSYLDAVNTMNGKLGAQGRVQGADAAKNITTTTVDWKDNNSHLRLLDRSSEHLVGISLADQSTLNSLSSLRTSKVDDPNAIDPSVLQVTKGGLSDPNASGAPSASASGKKPAPKKK